MVAENETRAVRKRGRKSVPVVVAPTIAAEAAPAPATEVPASDAAAAAPEESVPPAPAPIAESVPEPAVEAVAEPAPAPAVAKKKAVRGGTAKSRSAARAAKSIPVPAAPAPASAKPIRKPVPRRRAVTGIVSKKPVAAPAQPVASAISKGYLPMATVAETTDKVQALFGDFTGKAKAAYEKSTKLTEEATDFAKGNVEALVASGKIAVKGVETIGQEAVEYGKKNIETATAAFKTFAAAKTPTELFQAQSDYAKSSFDAAVAEASKFSETWIKLAGDVFQPLSNRYAVAADKLKAAAF